MAKELLEQLQHNVDKIDAWIEDAKKIKNNEKRINALNKIRFTHNNTLISMKEWYDNGHNDQQPVSDVVAKIQRFRIKHMQCPGCGRFMVKGWQQEGQKITGQLGMWFCTNEFCKYHGFGYHE